VLENVLAIGYNGNARGIAQQVRFGRAGKLRVHSFGNERARQGPGSVRDKVVFVSASPA